MLAFDPIQTSQLSRKEKIAQRIWECLRVVAFRYTPFFMREWRRTVIKFFVFICGKRGCEIAKDASLSSKCRIDYPWRLSIGERSSIGDGSWVYALERITIGKMCV